MHLTKTTNAFAKYFTTLKDLDWTHPIALAVSGGGDSMALLATALDYRDSLNLSSSLLVLTVDHGIRSEAAREAEMVQTYCDKRCVHHEILTWSGSLPTSAVAENARNIRRRLLLDACLQRGFHQLALAHTMDDVAETLLMRVRRGGLRGHASIPLKTHLSEITIYRPFLGLRRGELRQALSQIDVAWVDDPTNEDIRYERPRVRQVLRRLENTSYGTRQIAAYAQIMGRFRKVLSEQISRLVAQACSLSGDDLEIEPNALKNYPGTVGLETLRELVRFVGGDAHMIDRKQAGQVLEKLVSSANTLKPFSAGRCVLSPKKDGTWTLSRANRALPTVQVSGGKSVRWDGRYVVSFSGKADETVTISPHNVLPRVMQDTANCKIIFRPQVMDGPVSCLDKAIFREFSALLDPAVS